MAVAAAAPAAVAEACCPRAILNEVGPNSMIAGPARTLASATLGPDVKTT